MITGVGFREIVEVVQLNVGQRPSRPHLVAHLLLLQLSRGRGRREELGTTLFQIMKIVRIRKTQFAAQGLRTTCGVEGEKRRDLAHELA